MPTANSILDATDPEAYAAGQTVFQEGQLGNRMYVVKEGRVDLLIRGRSIASVGRGGILGEMALIDSKSRSATAVAKTDCQLVPIDEERFTSLVQQNPHFALQVMRVLAQRLRHMDEQV
jgi:CRP/FNR family cyclic AMP-dependent transcriptional regulator